MVMEPVVTFTDCTAQLQRFFALLPDDWAIDIQPCWNDYADSSRIYALAIAQKLIGGGIVFSKPAPDTLAYVELAQTMFDRGYLYFGFLWIDPHHRGHDYGGLWLRELRRSYPGQAFWLAIEDPGLRRFYERNGFSVDQELQNNGQTEWIMIDAAQVAD
jgi:GNAT superfamily N-acetyltransferase